MKPVALTSAGDAYSTRVGKEGAEGVLWRSSILTSGPAREAKDDAAFAELPQLLALARRPNVAAKVSALPRYSSEAYPYPRLHPHLRRVFDAFGPNACSGAPT
jgi:hypothetical protein